MLHSNAGGVPRAYPGGRIHEDVVVTPLSRVLDEDGRAFHDGGPR
jgi:hypothetical protein